MKQKSHLKFLPFLPGRLYLSKPACLSCERFLPTASRGDSSPCSFLLLQWHRQLQMGEVKNKTLANKDDLIVKVDDEICTVENGRLLISPEHKNGTVLVAVLRHKKENRKIERFDKAITYNARR